MCPSNANVPAWLASKYSLVSPTAIKYVVERTGKEMRVPHHVHVTVFVEVILGNPLPDSRPGACPGRQA